MSTTEVSYNASFLAKCLHGCLLTNSSAEITIVPLGQDDLPFLGCAILVVTMQLGFAMLEVGSARAAHQTTILAKNLLDSTISMLGFWAFCRWSNTRLVSDDEGALQSHLIFFHSTFCSTASTICGGSMAERTHLNAYMFFAIFMSLVIYPQIAQGAWTPDAMLSSQFHHKFTHGYDYHDFAGGGVVHLCGGCCALMGNILLGRRIMNRHRGMYSSTIDVPQTSRHDADPSCLCSAPEEDQETRGFEATGDSFPSRMNGRINHRHHVRSIQSTLWLRRFESAERDKHEFQPAASHLQIMGMFILWIGWYGFNIGTTISIGKQLAGKVAMNTTLSACAAGLGSYLHCYYILQRIDLNMICNGILSGLVATTASCNFSTEAASVVIGFLAGSVIYPTVHRVTIWLKLDDPVDAVPVHAGSGLFGILAVPFCWPKCDGRVFSNDVHFCSNDYQIGSQLAAQVWGALTIIAYSCCLSLLVWGLPAISECVLALEDERLEHVTAILMKFALTSSADLQLLDESLAKVVQQSRIAAKILKQYGWTGDCFENSDYRESTHLLHIYRHVKSEQNSKFKTALEVSHWYFFYFIASIIRRCNFHSMSCCTFRLRVLPESELKGLGMTDIEGGWIAAQVQRLLKKEANTSHDLMNEMQHLHALVHGQEALLRSLTRMPALAEEEEVPRMPTIMTAGTSSPRSASSASSPAFLSHARYGERVAERFASPGDPASPPNDSRSLPNVGRWYLLPRMNRTYAGSARQSSTSASTKSDNSVGAISAHSADETTPPPSLLGRIIDPVNIRANPVPQESATFNSMAFQLTEALQQHQRSQLTMQSASPESRV